MHTPRFFSRLKARSEELAKAAGRGRQTRLESLEVRLALSSVPVDSGPFKLTYADAAIVAEVIGLPSSEQTSPRTSLYDALHVHNAGDHYWSDGEKISLWRADDEFVIDVGVGSESKSVVDRLVADAGLLNDFDVAKELGAGRFILSRSNRDAKSVVDLAAVGNAAGVVWAAPLFTFGERGSWFAINNEVIVALHPGVTATEFFSTSEFRGYRPLLGTSDQFVATLASTDGLDALSLANRLHFDARVAWAAPNGNADFESSVLPNVL